MFSLSPGLLIITRAAGEPITVGYQPCDGDSTPEDLTGRRFIFAVYDTNQTELAYEPAVIVGPSDNSYASWQLDGHFTRGWSTLSQVNFEIAEANALGHYQVTVGRVKITESAPRVDEYVGGPTPRWCNVLRRFFDPALGVAARFSLTNLPLTATTTPPPSGGGGGKPASADFSDADNSFSIATLGL